MDVAGLAIGVAGLSGLFSATLEAIDRVQSFLSAETDAGILDARFKASRTLFREWGRRVGIQPTGQGSTNVVNPQHPALSDPSVAAVVQNLLKFIHVLCTGEDAPPQAPPGVSLPASLQQAQNWRHHFHDTMPIRSVTRKRERLKWALGDKKKTSGRVEELEKLVEHLYGLVPPDSMDSTTSSNRQTFVGMVDSSDLAQVAERIRADLNMFMERQEADKKGELVYLLYCSFNADPKIRLIAERRREMQAWLLGFSVPSERCEESLQAKMDGSCEWIFQREAFSAWASTPTDSKSKLLWLKGQAGFGKTILCARIVEHLSSLPENTVAHFFFSSEHQSRDDPYEALRAWISQLIAQHEGALSHAFETWSSSAESTATRSTLIKLLSNLIRMINGCTLIADGIDECTNQENSNVSVQNFLSAIFNASAGTSSRILIVSRAEPAVHKSLETIDLGSFSVDEYVISQEDVRLDTSNYAASLVSSVLTNKNEDDQLSLSQSMASTCRGQFLWLKLQQKALRKWMNKKQLERVIKDCPPALHRLYDRTWARILSLEDRERLRAFQLLRWVCFAARPMTVLEITEAVLIGDNPEELPLDEMPDVVNDDYINTEILDLCSPLLEVVAGLDSDAPGLRQVRIPHFSIQEYLGYHLPASGNAIFLNHSLGIPLDEAKLSAIGFMCLRYLEDERVWLDLPPDRPGNSFLDFAVNCWPDYFLEAQHPSYIDVVAKFMQASNPTWKNWVGAGQGHGFRTAVNFCSEPFWVAFVLGLVDLVNVLLEYLGPIDNELHNTKLTALTLACVAQQPQLVEVVFSHGANVNAIGEHGKTALHHASEFDNVKIVEMLLKNGADVSLQDVDGFSPLHFASLQGNHGVITLLLSERADLGARTVQGCTPLHVAVIYNHLDAVRSLLDGEADPSVVADCGWAPVHFAAAGGFVELLELLLDAGAEIDSETTNGKSPLDIAIPLSHLKAAQLLIKRGATVSLRMRHVLIRAAVDKKDIDMVETLYDKEIRTNNVRGVESLLYDVCFCDGLGWPEAATMLIAKGVNLTSPEGDLRYTLLQRASMVGNTKIARLLLNAGAPVNATAGEHATTPLFTACSLGKSEVVKLLLDFGADTSCTSNLQMPILSVACISGHIGTVQVLIDHGVLSSLTKESVRFHVSYAREWGHHEIVKLLLDQTGIQE